MSLRSERLLKHVKICTHLQKFLKLNKNLPKPGRFGKKEIIVSCEEYTDLLSLHPMTIARLSSKNLGSKSAS